MTFRHSKIVCTIGPASKSRRIVEKLLRAGMDVARLNFSHGKHEDHAANIALLRAAGIPAQYVHGTLPDDVAQQEEALDVIRRIVSAGVNAGLA